MVLKRVMTWFIQHFNGTFLVSTENDTKSHFSISSGCNIAVHFGSYKFEKNYLFFGKESQVLAHRDMHDAPDASSTHMDDVGCKMACSSLLLLLNIMIGIGSKALFYCMFVFVVRESVHFLV